MRYVLLLLSTVLLFGWFFGCAGQSSGQSSSGQSSVGEQLQNNIPLVPGTTADECTPSYSFSELNNGTLAQNTSLVATVSCAGGKRITVNLDGEEVTSVTPETNATQPLTLVFAPKKDGTVTLTVNVDNETVYSREWDVAPLGYSGTSGTEIDGVSFKEWRAMAVKVDDEISPTSVRLLAKRLDFHNQNSTVILVQLRKDDGGNPGQVIAEARRPIEAFTLTENWITFEFDNRSILAPGTYWIAVQVDQTEGISTVSDTIYIHMTPNDKQQPGNDYTRVMKLNVDKETGLASETSWEPLPYDRVYSIVLKSS